MCPSYSRHSTEACEPIWLTLAVVEGPLRCWHPLVQRVLHGSGWQLLFDVILSCGLPRARLLRAARHSL